ncbi:hypothetical protein ACIBG0_00075 [Nocardia sp. NPDC050630]|uniref:hypothetical protein n=1 Tax=Nocardia sp. NPDC050630 TaxID=3364321 RepID=UPI00379C6EB7
MGAAGEFLVELAERLTLRYDPATIHAVAERACGGQLEARRPDGRRASLLTRSGIPFEVSVTGGRGNLTPVLRYTTETATQNMKIGSRADAQLAAIGDLVRWLPKGDETVVELFQSFVATLYPDPTKVPPRSATWIGVAHDTESPHHTARLKMYCGLNVSGALRRLCSRWPGFAEFASAPADEKLIKPVFATIEVDAHGEVIHKLYLRARPGDVAVPMKLVRYFGDQAWEVLSELVRCGADAAKLHEQDFFVSCARGSGAPVFGLDVGAREHDMTGLVRELASKHHGTPHAVDALAQAAESCGATLRYSFVGMGFSAEQGIDKLKVYGTPTWTTE